MNITTAAAALALCLVAAAAQAAPATPSERAATRAADKAVPGGAAPERAARASRRKPRIVHLPSPSEESQAQRDRRLARECRGLPNAGACLGHALAGPRRR